MQGGFLELLTVYFKSMFACWEGNTFLQKAGVCIGSCIVPLLSNLYLAHRGRILSRSLDASSVVKVFRFVDDFLIVLDCAAKDFQILVSNVLSCCKSCIDPPEITHELSTEGSLWFLDLRLIFSEHHVCWSYKPRGKKPLNFQSAHSKLVKRGIVKLCLTSVLNKSCIHSLKVSFDAQIARLKSTGYPSALLTAVAEDLLKRIRWGERPKRNTEKKRTAVVPYIHKVSHGLKKIGNCININVAFSAPNKLLSLCRKVNDGTPGSWLFEKAPKELCKLY